jgi:arsenate reductase
MQKIYHLSTCNTCQKIIQELAPKKQVQLQDIKSDKITTEQLDELATFAGSYEALFSRKAIKYRTLGLAAKVLTEKEYRTLILEEYTFLKRPVVVAGKSIFIGNAAKTVAAAKEALAG